MAYKISKLDVVGKVKKAEFESGQKGVTFFSTHPQFADLKVGDTVDGDLTRSDYNGKEGWIMNQINKPSTFKKGGVTEAVKEAQAVKREDIKGFQETKQEAIKLSQTLRDSVLITVAEINVNRLGDETIENRILYWRNWLSVHWDDEQEPFK